MTDRAVFTDAYAVIPKGTMRDIVTSYLPFWEGTRLWVLSRPAIAALPRHSRNTSWRFSPAAAATGPKPTRRRQAVLFVVEGSRDADSEWRRIIMS